MRQWTVLLLGDDPESMRVWQMTMTERGGRVTMADITRERAEDFVKEPPDLVIFDVYRALPAAMTACRKLRGELVNPILMVAYFGGEIDMLDAYEAGADDCIARPVGGRLIWAKVRAWLRRAWTMPTEAMSPREVAGLRLYPETRHLRLADGREIGLTNLETRLLYLLMTHPGQVLEPSLIIDRVWGFEGAEPGALKAMVYRLRRKIEPDPAHPRYIHTVSGGYVFDKR
jgi:DNA-binding response OmpR family regulator